MTILTLCILASTKEQAMKFHDTIGRLFGVTNQLYLKNLQDELDKAGLPITAEQFKMMSRLWEQDGVSQQFLAGGVGTKRAAAGRMIDTLEKKGLIIRKSHQDDRRLNLIFLTRKGKLLRSKAEKCAQVVLDKSVQDFDRKDIDQLRTAVKKIIHNLS